MFLLKFIIFCNWMLILFTQCVSIFFNLHCFYWIHKTKFIYKINIVYIFKQQTLFIFFNSSNSFLGITFLERKSNSFRYRISTELKSTFGSFDISPSKWRCTPSACLRAAVALAISWAASPNRLINRLITLNKDEFNKSKWI